MVLDFVFAPQTIGIVTMVNKSNILMVVASKDECIEHTGRSLRLVLSTNYVLTKFMFLRVTCMHVVI